MKQLRLIANTLIYLCLPTLGWAQAPAGYYASCAGKSGAALLQQLEKTVGPHTTVSYDGLWEVYTTSDVRPDGSVWDIYSTKAWQVGREHCGNYSYVGDCINREHSMPKSWFGGATPMYSDAFHLYPTDGRVNGQRSNYPYGECAQGTSVPSHGGVAPLGRLGQSTFAGYSGTVFEPDDQYKGDLARSYFYMAAAYNGRIASWNSDMLASNAYPAFSAWAVELLLKWHRQDPVSDKERTRNEAIYAHQHNRNPFIDNPDMAEHIWGSAKTEGWQPATPVEPFLSQPAGGSVIDLGRTVAAVARSITVTVAGGALTDNVSLSVSPGSPFAVAPATLTPQQVADGAEAIITFCPKSAGSYSSVLTLLSGSVENRVTLTGECITTLPAGPVTAIDDHSFVATWSYIGDATDGRYTLDLYQDNSLVAGYPVSVVADSEQLYVDGLQPSTRYEYVVRSASLASERVAVTTLDPIPTAEVIYEGNLTLVTAAGQPSQAAALWLDLRNMPGDVTLAATAPFELSADGGTWCRSLCLQADADCVYLRLGATEAGTYEGSLSISSGSYFNDDFSFTGVATATNGFYEDFDHEPGADGLGSYSDKTYHGTGCDWLLTNAGLFASQDNPWQGTGCIRLGKNATSAITMASDFPGGFGQVSFYAAKWVDSDAPVTLNVECSTDGGSSWVNAGAVNVSSAQYRQYSVAAGICGNARLRIRQSTGGRAFIDLIEGTICTTGADAAVCGTNSWQAWSPAPGCLQLAASAPTYLQVFALDGTPIYNATAAEATVALSPGVYIAVAHGQARRIAVR